MKNNARCYLSKNSIFSTGLILTVMTCLLSCDKGNDPATTTPAKIELEGNKYTLTSAKLTKDITVDGKTIAKEKELSSTIALTLFSIVSCKDKQNNAFYLKDNKELYLTCFGETSTNDKKAGTWSSDNDKKTLTLNITTPFIKTPFIMGIENLKIENNVASGLGKNIPMPKGMLTGASIDQDDVVRIDLNVTFQKR